MDDIPLYVSLLVGLELEGKDSWSIIAVCNLPSYMDETLVQHAVNHAAVLE